MAETPETVEVNVVMGAQLRAIVRSALLHVKNKVRETLAEDMATQTVTDLINEELEKWPLSADPEDTLPEWLFKRFNEYGRWDSQSEETKLYWEHEAAAVRRAVGRGGFKTSPNEVEISTPIGDLHQTAANSGDEVKGYIQLDLKHAETLGEAIRIAVGAASTCWGNLDQAGVFQPEVALDIATQLEHHVNEYLRLLSGQIMERHQKLGDLLHKYFTAGQPMISIRQVQDVIAGRANPEEYNSALQVRPNQYITEMHCWCGGMVGKREPGDENGLGCLDHIEHNYKARIITPGFDGPEGTEWEGGRAHRG